MHVLVPVKDQVLAKGRLSGVLAPNERRLLNQAMLEDVLSVVSEHRRIAKTVLVSDDPVAALLADKYAAESFSVRGADARDLNGSLRAACKQLAERGVDDILIVHGDLPMLQGTDLDALIEQSLSVRVDVVLGPDSRNDGTNALLFANSAFPALHYGPGSFARHKAMAQRCGLDYAVVRRPGVARDVDTASDLLAVFAARARTELGRHTAGFLSRREVAERLRLLREAGIGATDDACGAVNE